jgi:hypothetical protein
VWGRTSHGPAVCGQGFDWLPYDGQDLASLSFLSLRIWEPNDWEGGKVDLLARGSRTGLLRSMWVALLTSGALRAGWEDGCAPGRRRAGAGVLYRGYGATAVCRLTPAPGPSTGGR